MLALMCQLSHADTVYQSQEDFIKETFKEDIKPAIIWLDKPTQDELAQILGHNYPQARLRYWRKGDTSAWILEEIGKEYPITAGFVVTDDSIQRAQVLIYRETRGMEIHLSSFLAQFKNNKLANDQLANKIDGIAGATMSTDAMVKMARVALTLNRKATQSQ